MAYIFGNKLLLQWLLSAEQHYGAPPAFAAGTGKGGEGGLRLGRKPRTQGPLHLLVGVMLCCLVTLFPLSVPITSLAQPSEAGRGDNAPLPDENDLLAVANEVETTDELITKAAHLVLLVLATAPFGAGSLRMLKVNAGGRGAGCSWGVEGRLWSAAAREGPSFLGVFLL